MQCKASIYPCKGLAMAALACAQLLSGRWALCQVDTGALLGTVKDQSGAVIPGAKVSLTNEGTSFTLATVTGADGTYVFTPIKIGRYTVEAEFAGFQKARKTGIDVNIQSQVVVNFSLVPGALSHKRSRL